MEWKDIAGRGGPWGVVASVARSSEEIGSLIERAEERIAVIRRDEDLDARQRDRKIAEILRGLDPEVRRWVEFGRGALESAEQKTIELWGAIKPDPISVSRVAALRQEGLEPGEIVERAGALGDPSLVDAGASFAAYSGPREPGRGRRWADLSQIGKAVLATGVDSQASRAARYAVDLGKHAEAFEQATTLAARVTSGSSPQSINRTKMAMAYAQGDADSAPEG